KDVTRTIHQNQITPSLSHGMKLPDGAVQSKRQPPEMEPRNLMLVRPIGAHASYRSACVPARDDARNLFPRDHFLLATNAMHSSSAVLQLGSAYPANSDQQSPGVLPRAEQMSSLSQTLEFICGHQGNIIRTITMDNQRLPSRDHL